MTKYCERTSREGLPWSDGPRSRLVRALSIAACLISGGLNGCKGGATSDGSAGGEGGPLAPDDLRECNTIADRQADWGECSYRLRVEGKIIAEGPCYEYGAFSVHKDPPIGSALNGSVQFFLIDTARLPPDADVTQAYVDEDGSRLKLSSGFALRGAPWDAVVGEKLALEDLFDLGVTAASSFRRRGDYQTAAEFAMGGGPGLTEVEFSSYDEKFIDVGCGSKLLDVSPPDLDLVGAELQIRQVTPLCGSKTAPVNAWRYDIDGWMRMSCLGKVGPRRLSDGTWIKNDGVLVEMEIDF